MNKVLFAGLFLGAFLTMMRHGIGKTFAYWMLPTILLVNFAKSMAMPGLPNLTSLNMILYGTVCGLPFHWGELRKLRWGLLDTGILLVLIPIGITTFTISGDPKLAQRQVMESACQWLFPYLMARVALQDAGGRSAALKSVCWCSMLIGVLTAIESSGVRPNITSRVLEHFNLDTTANDMVMYRYGMARAIATGGQQIDLGNMGILAGTMILVLAPATGTKWTKPWVFGGILGAGAMVFGSVSMTSWQGMAVAFLCYYLLSRPALGKYLVFPILAVEVILMLAVSNNMLHATIADTRPDNQLEASRWIRIRIIQDAWPIATQSGWFGNGKDLDTHGIGVGSVDNSYLLFILQYGWFCLTVWGVLMLLFAITATSTLAHATTASERYPAAAAVAGVLSIFFAMYTVFFGFAYAELFFATLGMVGAMHQMMAKPRPAAVSLHGGVPPHAYAMMAGGLR